MEVLSDVLFVGQTGAALWLASRWSRRLLPNLTPGERALTTLILFASIAQVSLVVCGLAGQLTAGCLAVVMGVGVLAEFRLGRSAPAVDEGTTDPAPAPWPWPAVAIVVLVSIISAWAVVGSGTLFGWDTLSYHAVAPAWWIQQGDLSLPPFNYQSYYPMNAEVQALWFMLPHGIDAYANLASLIWIAILVAVWVVHAHRLGQARWLAALALAGFLFSPNVAERLPYFTSADLSMACLLAAMLTLTWNPGGVSRPGARALLAGLAGGLAMGMKVAAAPHLALAGLCWAKKRSGEWPLIPMAAFVGGVALTGGYWYLRNLALTGNPFYPAELGPFAGPFDAQSQYGTSLLAFMRAGWDEAQTWRILHEEFLNWPTVLGWLAVLGVAVGGICAWRTKDAAARGHLWLLAGSALVFVLLFPMQPFSAGANRPDAQASFNARYLTYPFLLGLLLLPTLWRAKPKQQIGVRPVPGLLRGPGFVACLVLLMALSLSKGHRAAHTTENLYRTFPKLAAGWKALEELPPGARVAVQSYDPPSHSLNYPLFGREYQLTPVAVNLDGSRRVLLHERQPTESDSWWGEFRATARQSGKVRLGNLRDAGVEYLLLQNWPKGKKILRSNVIQLLRAVKSLPDEQRLFDDPTSKLWHISEQVE
jgi:hypothetical protein